MIRRLGFRQTDMVFKPHLEQLRHRPYLYDLPDRPLSSSGHLLRDPELDLLLSFARKIGLNPFPVFIRPE